MAGSKQGLLCTIVDPQGVEWNLLAVHFDHRDRATRIGSAAMAEALATELGGHLIAAGDFNSTDSPGEDDAVRRLLDGGAFESGPGVSPTFPSVEPVSTIDWILAGSGLQVVGVEVHDFVESDHLPVLATVRIREGAE